jgi:hypothetical protein
VACLRRFRQDAKALLDELARPADGSRACAAASQDVPTRKAKPPAVPRSVSETGQVEKTQRRLPGDAGQ